MVSEFHFIRPLWLFVLLPWVILAWRLLRQSSVLDAWSTVCDSHLLPYLLQAKGRNKRTLSLLLLLMSALLMLISLAGPTWSRLPVPTYQQKWPRVFVLDMSDSMLMTDISPDRLSHAKFKLHDLLQHRDVGQFGLVVYTGEPFVVSPLTDDGETIDVLLSSLTPDIMPTSGQRLDSALEQAGKLITQAGFQRGEILVFTSESPSVASIRIAQSLAINGIYTSVMPMLRNKGSGSLFQNLANAGRGQLIRFTDTTTDLEQWLTAMHGNHAFGGNLDNDIPMWKDQGRGFLLLSLVFLLPVFRRGWLQRINA